MKRCRTNAIQVRLLQKLTWNHSLKKTDTDSKNTFCIIQLVFLSCKIKGVLHTINRILYPFWSSNSLLLRNCHRRPSLFPTWEKIRTLCPSSCNFFNIFSNSTSLPEARVRAAASKLPLAPRGASWWKRKSTILLTLSLPRSH